MISKRLKYYRLKSNLSKKDLAALTNIPPADITLYENGQKKPSMETLKKFAEVFDIKAADFISRYDKNLKFVFREFQKSRRLTKRDLELIKLATEDYLTRFFTIITILGEEILPETPLHNQLQISENIEENAYKLRKHLGFNERGPLKNLVELLEDKGILIYFLDFNSQAFKGINGLVNERPFIVVNKNMTSSQIRETIAHELAHCFFKWPDNLENKKIEELATAIGESFLFTEKDAKWALGFKRKTINKDLTLVCDKYGISLALLVRRASKAGIISNKNMKEFFHKSRERAEDQEGSSKIRLEEPSLFSHLVFRAVAEDEISIQKGAELLNQTYEYVADQCFAFEI